MSTPSKTPPKKLAKQQRRSKQFEKLISEAIINRNKRLGKLLELNCPDVIIYNEIKMLRELSKSLESGRLYAQEKQERARRDSNAFIAIQKNRRNLCANIECDCYVSPNMRRPDGEKICTGCIGAINKAKKGQAEP